MGLGECDVYFQHQKHFSPFFGILIFRDRIQSVPQDDAVPGQFIDRQTHSLALSLSLSAVISDNDSMPQIGSDMTDDDKDAAVETCRRLLVDVRVDGMFHALSRQVGVVNGIHDLVGGGQAAESFDL